MNMQMKLWSSATVCAAAFTIGVGAFSKPAHAQHVVVHTGTAPVTVASVPPRQSIRPTLDELARYQRSAVDLAVHKRGLRRSFADERRMELKAKIARKLETTRQAHRNLVERRSQTDALFANRVDPSSGGVYFPEVVRTKYPAQTTRINLLLQNASGSERGVGTAHRAAVSKACRELLASMRGDLRNHRLGGVEYRDAKALVQWVDFSARRPTPQLAVAGGN